MDSAWADDAVETLYVSMSAIEDLPLYDIEKPFELWYPAEPQFPRTNCKFVDHTNVPVKDARTSLDGLTLDTAGFQFVHHKSQSLPKAGHGGIHGGDAGLEAYLNETITLVRDHLEAETVLCYDWRVSNRKCRGRRSLTNEVPQE